MFHATSVGMQDETRSRGRDFWWAFPTSAILHALVIAALVLFNQPWLASQPQEETVNVTLVSPQEQPKPKPPAEAPQAKKPPEAKQPPAAEIQPPKPSKIEVLKPVFRFGDKDAGADKSSEAGGAEATTPAPVQSDEVKPPAEQKPAAASDAKPQPAESKDAEPVQENQAEAIKDTGKQDTEKQQGQADGADNKETGVQMPLGADGSDGDIALPALAKAPQPRPADTPRSSSKTTAKSENGNSGGRNAENTDVAASQPFSGLPGVRRPRSQGINDASATTSMAGVSRNKRAAQLCASALQQKLLAASYNPDLVPLVPLSRGNVLDVPEAAFRTRTEWHRLSFRCEVDKDATTIVSLSFRVGGSIPRDQWARLGLPTTN